MPQRRSILIVAYFFPPLASIGARRPHALAKYLRRAGHEVTVLTSVRSGVGPEPAVDRMLRTRDLLETRLNWRAANFAAVSGGGEGTWEPGFNVWGALIVPDGALLTWAPFALLAARALRPDVVITTSPVESAHLIGLALRRRGVPWIADFRDGWCFEAARPDWPLSAQRRFDLALERRVVQRADAVVAVTEPIVADLAHRHGIRADLITNGFDPEDRPSPGPPTGLLHAGRTSLVYTGGLGSERTLVPLLDAIRGAPDLRERLELVVAGGMTAAERDLYARPELAGLLRHVGVLERGRALRLQREADLLVLATTGVRRSEATGKLFEYLDSELPILVLGDDSEAARIVARAGAGLAAPTHDVPAIETAVRALLSGAYAGPGRDLDAYRYPALAARYGELIEEVLGRSARGGPTRAAPSTAAPAL